MPYDDLSAVQREAYLHAPSNLITLHTLEVRHPSFTQPLRIVRDNEPLTARLEANAPVNAGVIVDFIPLSFDFIPPEIGDQPDPTIKVRIDNVTGEITRYLELATSSAVPIECSYRMYLWDVIDEELATAGDVPSAEPLHMELFNATSINLSITFTISLAPVANVPFPPNRYTPDVFRGIAP